MPFQFVCPFCHSRTKVADEYLGQSGPCANCGKHVTMPTRNAQGALVASLQTGAAPPKKKEAAQPRNRPMLALLAGSISLTVVAAIVVVFWFVVPAVRQSAELNAQRKDLENMKAIAEALNAYSDKYGTYPPPAVVNSAGKKLYSWRVLILPFLGYKDIYDKFQLDQPWDSPANTTFVTQMPTVFSSPSGGNVATTGESEYVLLTGAGTIFPPSGPLSRTAVTDPLTILLVETRTGNVNWTEPGDIDISVHGLKIGNTATKEIGGLHDKVIVAFTSDEVGLRIPKTTPQQVLDAMVTPTAGENVQASIFKD